MKILLTYISGTPDREDPYINLLPAGLCYLHACLMEAGFDTVLANFSGWPAADITKQLSRLKPELVGISQWTHNRHFSIDLARLVRRKFRDCTIVMGGGHATFSYEDILAQGSPVDIVVIGEGEATMLELAGRFAEGREWRDVQGIAFRRGEEIHLNPSRPLLDDLDTLPYAGRYLENSIGVDLELQQEFILTARGCLSTCHFCSSPGFWNRRVRFRSPENIVDEILNIRDRYGLMYFSLRDDTFTADRKRAITFCRMLVDRRAHVLWNCQSRVTALDEELLIWMKRAGCECVQLGVESGSPRILSMLGKTITPLQVEEAAALVRKVGINLSVYLISDVPGETLDDIGQTIDLVRNIQPDDGYVSPLAYYPGTHLFEEAVSAGRIDRGIFEKSRDTAVYVTAPGPNSRRRLLNALVANQPGDASSFDQQKRLLGYCFTTNVLSGEFYLQHGDPTSAERELIEITGQEPENPWGWYLLGDLYAELGKKRMAERSYRRVLELLPKHGPSLAAVGIKKAGPR